jgi:hypothetical protein
VRSQSPHPSFPSVDLAGLTPTAATLAEAARPLRRGADDPIARRAARRSLRGQIVRLERELVEQRCSKWPRATPDLGVRSRGPALVSPESAPAGRGGAQLLGIGELEALRDDLVATLSAERRALAARTCAEEESRRLREELLLDPVAYAGARVRSADVGEGGCGEVRSEPAGGVLGMLMGWWRVVVSSGCP